VSFQPPLRDPIRTLNMGTAEHIRDAGLASVLETTQTAHEQALMLADLVARANADSPADVRSEISKQQKVLNGNLAHLRGQHRKAQFMARDTKGNTAEARQEVDRLLLQLNNLQYEQTHLEGEIWACESFE
jgi:THO complex subunit 5